MSPYSIATLSSYINKGALADKLKSVVFHIAVYKMRAKTKANLFSVDLKSLYWILHLLLRTFFWVCSSRFLKTKQKNYAIYHRGILFLKTKLRLKVYLYN